MDSRGWTAFAEREPTKDACLYDGLLLWHAYQGAIVSRWAERNHYQMRTHWQPMPRKGWIRREERLPTRADADTEGCVLARHEYDGIKMTGWHQIAGDKYLTHWHPALEPPEDAEEIRRRF